MENSKEQRHLQLELIIEATRGMDAREYLEFMELPGPERIKRVEEILKARNKGEE